MLGPRTSLDEPVFGCGRDRVGADVLLRSGGARSVKPGGPGVCSGRRRFPGAAGFAFDLIVISRPSCSAVRVDELFDRAGRFADADDVGDVDVACLRRRGFEAEADGVVGFGVCRRGWRRRDPSSGARRSSAGPARFDDFEPVAPEELPVVGDLPVAVEEALALGGGELPEGADVRVVVDMGVVGEVRGEEERLGSRLAGSTKRVSPSCGGAPPGLLVERIRGRRRRRSRVPVGGWPLPASARGCLAESAKHARR